jgi:hypothetical protein
MRARRKFEREVVARRWSGDLPPSSSVTGVRFARGRAITILRPTAVEPVKSRWSKGRRRERLRERASPGSDRDVVLGEGLAAGASGAAALEVAGVCSEGLIIARLPAASAAVSGARASCTG